MRCGRFFLIVLATLFFARSAGAQRSFIVEFADSPEARKSGGPTEPQLRFRGDLAAVASSSAKGRNGGARIEREFGLLLHATAIRLEDPDAIERILDLPYVARILPDRTLIFDTFESSGPVATGSGVRGDSFGSGVVVAVIDSGIDYNHPALGAGFGPGHKVSGGYDFINDDADPMDDFGHGTHVAGIIAARSTGMSGLAPNATLLAYKVLDSTGQGPQSALIAALERAVDPNGDGDTSDRADVINISLGSFGEPDDPAARAADRASALGALVVGAVGNSGESHSIASPALARSVIAVGATDGGLGVAEFSARGPAPQTGAIKPDLLAPGALIRSTTTGGGFGQKSGTSMAAAYVSGVAAQLIEQHPTWSSERLRSAFLSGCVLIPDAPVEAQGAGRIDVPTVLQSKIAIDAPLGFGPIDRKHALHVSERAISLRSEYDVPVTIAAELPPLPSGVVLELFPSTIELPPNEERSIIVRLSVDTAAVDRADEPAFLTGGWVALVRGSERVEVPWAFLRAARVRTSWSDPFPQITWSSDRPARGSFAPIDPFTFETLLEPGTYDLALAGENDGVVAVVVREGVTVDGDMRLDFDTFDAPHEIEWSASDPSGGLLSRVSDDQHLYTVTGRLAFSDGARQWSMELPSNFSALRSSSFGARWSLLLAESSIDMTRNRVAVAQHEPLSALEADATLSIEPSGWARQDLRLFFPGDASERNLWVLPRGFTRRAVEAGQRPEGIGVANVGAAWSGSLWMTPETHSDYASGVQFGLYTGDPGLQGTSTVITPTLRRRDDRFLTTRSMDPAPLPSEAAAGMLNLGAGLIWPSIRLVTDGGPAALWRWGGSIEVIGDRNDLRRLETAKAVWRLLDDAGEPVAGGTLGLGGFAPTQKARRLELQVASPNTDAFAASRGTFSAIMADGGDPSPPSLTSFVVVGPDGSPSRVLDRRGAKLVFSAADYTPTWEENFYLRIDESATRVWYRPASGEWIPLAAVAIGEDSGREKQLGRFPVGVIYEADLTALPPGLLSFRVEIADPSGNRSTWTLEPSVLLEDGAAPRRRAVRRE